MLGRAGFAAFQAKFSKRGSVRRFDVSLYSSGIMTQEKMVDGVHKKFSADARDIFQHAVDSVLPAAMVKRNLKVRGDTLLVGEGDRIKELPINNNVYIVAFGKAVVGMVSAAEHVLSAHVRDGIASIPTNYIDTFKTLRKADLLPAENSKVTFYEGAKNNLPDRESHATAQKIFNLAKKMKENDIMLTLISGGGSSLLSFPIPPVSLEELRHVSKLMSTNGATIAQMNVVRKQLEVLKGGGLARVADPATNISLILSDVIGDNLGTIASGPTVRDYSTPEQCFEIFTRLGISSEVPTNVIELLQQKRLKYSAVGAGSGPRALSRSYNFIVGSNVIATERAAERARECGYLAFVLSTSVSDEAASVAAKYALLSRFICLSMEHKMGKDSRELTQVEIQLIQAGITKDKINELCALSEKSINTGKPVCIICGGEPVVTVRGTGIGGRNQETVLSFAVSMDERKEENAELSDHFAVQLFSAGTDGIDGPCDAAGAMVTPRTVTQAAELSLDAQTFLDNNDSYHFFDKLNDGANHVITGHTGTNVMDIQILMIHSVS